MVGWVDDVAERTEAAFVGQGDPERAAGAERYMKGIAPFLGLTVSERRSPSWTALSTPERRAG